MEDKEFEFLYKFAKKLVIKLNSYEDKTVGSQWLSFLRNSKNPSRNNYLKVFIASAHKQKLSGLFSKPPADDMNKMEEPENLYEFGTKCLETPKSVRQEEPIVSTMSGDRKEYAAVQAVPNFGVHVYYALSDVPIELEREKQDLKKFMLFGPETKKKPKSKCTTLEPNLRFRDNVEQTDF